MSEESRLHICAELVIVQEKRLEFGVTVYSGSNKIESVKEEIAKKLSHVDCSHELEIISLTIDGEKVI